LVARETLIHKEGYRILIESGIIPQLKPDEIRQSNQSERMKILVRFEDVLQRWMELIVPTIKIAFEMCEL
jgi:hypothetical protein